MDTESNIDDERYQLFLNSFYFLSAHKKCSPVISLSYSKLDAFHGVEVNKTTMIKTNFLVMTSMMMLKIRVLRS